MNINLRSRWLSAALAAALLSLPASVPAQSPAPGRANLALVARPSTSFVSGHENLDALNDGAAPSNSNDKRATAYGNWPRNGLQWVQYDWSQPVNVDRMEVYWFDDQGGVRLPVACRLKYWDGTAFAPVSGASGLGLEANRFNTTTFQAVTTAKLRLEFDSNGKSSTGLLEWRVFDTGQSANFAPVAQAGVDRVVVLPAPTRLNGTVKDDGKPMARPATRWNKESGPGEAAFADPAAAQTTATFSKPGAYILALTATDGQLSATGRVAVTVENPPPATHLTPLITRPYSISSPFWNARAKALIENWIPHCMAKIADTNLPEGGLVNFVQAGLKLAGKPHARHKGPVFANAWVHNTIEAMCVALCVEPGADTALAAAQASLRARLDEWIPQILSAQEPDGYLQTCYTLDNHRRWSNKADHEGYLAGYFIESALAHHVMTGGKDTRMYLAARKLADCWCRNIGPAPKRAWYEGHQAFEMALVRLARFVDDLEGPGKGQAYVDLAKFLLDSRKDGHEYDQSHLPVTEQYEAVGHAVRAVYSYSGMADIAMETGSPDYQSAVRSIWANLVQKKYYVTGGVGSGETSEGFGKDYSLPNHAYCESCSGCGELFFQHKMNLAWQEARYADLFEETLYNAILGDVDLDARNFTYTNPLDSAGARYKWHVCPCCVGNIPRTLLMLPTWMYTRSSDALYVNLFAGSTVAVGPVAGTQIQVVQRTEYPWKEAVSLTLNPAQPARFSLHVRQPDRQTTCLYTSTPAVTGLAALRVNGQPVTPEIRNGYAVITRQWSAGDRVEFNVPLRIQRVRADSRVAADTNRVALRYGPLVYNFESADQNIEQILAPDAPLSTEWRPDLLGGVTVIRGSFASGAPFIAIPNYARNNRGGRSIVWIRER